MYIRMTMSSNGWMTVVASELNDEVGMIIVTSSTDEIMTCKQILIHSVTVVMNLPSVSPCSPILCCSSVFLPQSFSFLSIFWYFLLFLFSPLSFSSNLFFLKFLSP